MTDYYQVIAHGIGGLDKNSPDSRREFYWLARTELEVQLCGLDPPLTHSEIVRERLALDEAIRKLEAEHLLPVTPRLDTAPARPLEPPEPEGSCIGRRELAPDTARLKPDSASQEERENASTELISAQLIGELSKLDPEQSPHTTVEVLRDPGEPVENLEAHPHSFAQTIGPIPQERKSPPEPWPAIIVPDVNQIDRRIGSPTKRGGMTMPAGENTLGITGLSHCPDVRAPPRPRRRPREAVPVGRARGSATALKTAFLSVFIIVTLPLTGYWQRDRLAALFVKSTAMQTQRNGQPWLKTAYHVDELAQLGSLAGGQARSSQGLSAPIPQKVVLYEEDPAATQKKRYTGSVVWRTENISPGPGRASELAVKAELEIPERRMSAKLSICRNTDKALPATHMIEIIFNLPPDFPLGGISNVPGILMKPAEQTPGAPLAGLTAKVISGFFLFGASAAENDMQRNVELLKERGWFDIPIVYNNGRRAVLAVEKGAPGERAFKEAFVAWGS